MVQSIDPSDPPPESPFPSDFLSLDANPCFAIAVQPKSAEDGDTDVESLLPAFHASPSERDALAYRIVAILRRDLEVALKSALRNGRLRYRVHSGQPFPTDMTDKWAEVRGYIERQDGDRSAPLLDHIGMVVGLLARAGESSGQPTPPITSVDLMQFEHVMNEVVAMVEVAAGAVEEKWGERGT